MTLAVKLNPTICRRLIITYLIATQERANNPLLESQTGWPRRTIQDIIAKGLPGHGVEIEFVQQGVRNNDGYYRLLSWGSIDRQWVVDHIEGIAAELNIVLS